MPRSRDLRVAPLILITEPSEIVLADSPITLASGSGPAAGGGLGPGGGASPAAGGGAAGASGASGGGSSGSGQGGGGDPGGDPGGGDGSGGDSGDDGGSGGGAAAAFLFFRGCITPTAVVYRSKSSTYTLIGFSEFVSPSVPPKKYRHKTTGGQVTRCNFLSSIDCLGSVNQNGSDKNVMTMACQYNAITGALTSTGARTVFQDFGVCPAATQIASVVDCALVYADEAQLGVTETQTTQVEYSKGNCLLDGAIYSQVVTNRTMDIDDEDTDDDAVARAVAAVGWDGSPSSVSTIGVRGAGQFSASFVYVEVAFDLTGATAGATYNITITFGRRVSGSGTAFFPYLTEVHSFVAAGGAETTPYIPLPIETGFDTNVHSYTICLQP